MDEDLKRMLEAFDLTGDQREAAAERDRNVAVTAGAGSGKTRTLVARYLGLLGQGLHPRQVAAITFTEKAAREMRSRARQELHKLALNAQTEDERQRWSRLNDEMDSARIGTIHSLCAEILHSHPAEAGLDPRAVVLEENQAGVLRAAAVENTLAWLTQQPEAGALFRNFSISALQQLMALLLSKRLEVTTRSFDPSRLAVETRRALQRFLEDDRAAAIRVELRQSLYDHTLAAEAGDGMAAQVVELLAGLDAAETSLSSAAGDPTAAALALFQARRSQMRLNVGKRVSPVKDAVRELRDRYDVLLAWMGGANPKDPPPDPLVEAALAETAPLVGMLFEQVRSTYQSSRTDQSGLDFDDLEDGAVSLLADPAVRAYWQNELKAVLVDEFQDTNIRQRQIIQALCGEQSGRLFVVGDARQSIYRFRGADVTVFPALQADIQRHGGLVIDLDRTFRAHPGLLNSTGELLGQIMGSQPDPQLPFAIPYSALHAERKAQRPGIQAPFIECILAAGENADTARPAAARALANRLLELKERAEIGSWEEVALLFRASTTFPVYEQALEEAGIPFVTVAGSGFYNRPEVRDLLNMLHTLAEPWDDQALAGLLRSPAIGISDSGLYRLRSPSQPLRAALAGDLEALSPSDREHARRALDILEELEPKVDRLPVSELLQRLVERTDYQATLACAAALPGSARLWRNVDKLINDAQVSGLVRVRAFLEYIATLRDVGVREGEAASEAEGAVRLMTIHKSKGLEFPLVVLADAGRKPNSRSDLVCRLGEAWTFPLDKLESSPLAYRLASWQDERQSEAEELRLLYVALTRAQDKLILSGHMRLINGQTAAEGWLKILLDAGGQIPEALAAQAGKGQRLALPAGGEWAIFLAALGAEVKPVRRIPAVGWPDAAGEPLYAHLSRGSPASKPGTKQHHLNLEPNAPPARVVGEMVHKALQRWRFPGDPALTGLLRTSAQSEGLLEEDLIQKALWEAETLLRRFQGHPLFKEIDAAPERHHEVPYVGTDPKGGAEWGFMDCLYRAPGGWVLVDFKTDRLRDQAGLEENAAEYLDQLLRYRQAASRLLSAAPRALMCFLNVERSIVIREISE